MFIKFYLLIFLSFLVLKAETLSVIAVGDIMMGSIFPDNRLPENDGQNLFQETKTILKNADLTFGNLEGVFLDSTGNPKAAINTSTCFSFRMPEHYVNYLKESGFDLISIANNHIEDFGEPGKLKTIEILQKSNINFSGLPNYISTTVKIKNQTIGFCAFCLHENFKLVDPDTIFYILKQLKKQCSIIIISFHGGAEGKNARNVTKQQETFYGINRGNVYQFAHSCIDSGASLILGHGPHVTRSIELYKNKLICYSLGNFCTYGWFNITGPMGRAPIIKIWIDQNGNFVSGQIISIYQEKTSGPKLDSNQQALKDIIDLTQQDFTKEPLKFDSSGHFRTF